MNILDSLKKISLHFLGKRVFGFIPDDTYLKIRYRLRTGKTLDLDNPKTFNEKLQWLKLHDRKKIYTKMVDKYEAKKFVAGILGDEYVIPTLGLYNKFSEIDFDKLPNQFVMKCTHDSGGLILCKDKAKFNKEKARKIINKCLKRNYYYGNREWPYKNVKPRIIIEKYMSNESEDELKDYKFFNFNGAPKIVLVCSERSKNLKETWYDENFRKLDIIEGGHDNDDSIKKPKELKKMLELSKILSKNNVFVRTDFYEIDGRVYFGEITFFPASGFERFEPEKWDRKLGDLINLDSLK